MQIKEYKRLCMLETYNKKFYVFEADKLDRVDELIETQKFIRISWTRINTSNISDYGPIPSDPIYDFIVAMPEITRSEWLQIVKEYEKNRSSDSVLTVEKLAKLLRKSFRIPSGLGWFDKYQQFVIHFLHKNYPND